MLRLRSLLTASAGAILLIGSQAPASASLVFNLYQAGPNVVLETNGTLSLPGTTLTKMCIENGLLDFLSWEPVICAGPKATMNMYGLIGTPGFAAGSGYHVADASFGFSTGLDAKNLELGISPAYVSGEPIVSDAIFLNKTLADFGLTSSSGVLGSWQLGGTSETVTFQVDPPVPTTSVPGPLPVLGASAAFSISRRLRRRIRTAPATEKA